MSGKTLWEMSKQPPRYEGRPTQEPVIPPSVHTPLDKAPVCKLDEINLKEHPIRWLVELVFGLCERNRLPAQRHQMRQLLLGILNKIPGGVPYPQTGAGDCE
ncbi:MAG: hypothetical protein V2A63_03845 [Patescibacteria group bacterium]